MPATEQTWRDSKLLHVIFGISSVLMLIATIWMLAADHNREWKRYQREFGQVEAWTAQSRIDQEDNKQYHEELEKRQAALLEARQQDLPENLVEEFRAKVAENAKSRGVTDDFGAYDKANKALVETHEVLKGAAPQDKPGPRAKLVGQMRDFITDARFREDVRTTAKKGMAANFDVARSKYEIAVGKGDSPEQIQAYQANIDDVKQKLDAQVQAVQDAGTYRKKLEQLVLEMTRDEVAAAKALDDQRSKLTMLEKSLYERQNSFGKRLLEMPIIDAFGRPLKVEQIWLPKLTINYNFRDVARFDRCGTCHQGIDKTAPGSAINPAYEPAHQVSIDLPTPAEPPASEGEQTQAAKLKEFYGLRLAERGLLDADDVTLDVVTPESPGAKAGLMSGDVIVDINDVKNIHGTEQAYTHLIDRLTWGKPVKLSVRRGLPHPYVSHPRMDLFVGSLSPHKMQEVGCTICHEGQGSGTEFKWASHTPNDPGQAAAWRRNLGWFSNHHWIFPMNPKRFAESSCLKCHHEVTDLEASARFPDPPAPKLTAGYNLIRQYGCFGCHEINGFDGPNRRVGPDLRVEPNYSAAAQGLLATGALDGQQSNWASLLVNHPENTDTRHLLLASIKNAAGEKSEKNAKGEQGEKASVAAAATQSTVVKLGAVLDDVETPGKFRKVGPSLRHVGKKLDYEFLYSWIRRPKDFRPETRMPQFFGLREHLDKGGRAESEKFEPLEIRGVTQYLLTKSQPFEFAKVPKGVTEKPSVERGKKLFETRGCLACHMHSDFPAAKMTQGPDLSRIGAKLDRKGNPNGSEWLYTWLRNPSSYHPRTLMPNLFLEPIVGEKGQTSDPADDLTEFLLQSRGQDAEEKGGWQPTNVPAKQLDEDERKSLHDLALASLKEKFPTKQAEEFLTDGIPESRRSEIKGDEIELLGKPADENALIEKQLNYVGRRAITKYGCSGCHDVPGFEDAKPIGTGLADWGRKAPDKLAFELIAKYVTRGHGHGEAETEHDATGHEAVSPSGHAQINLADMDPTQGYFMSSLLGHQREGFIWQKLREPRSYDFEKTQNKTYNERLRMPKFNLDEKQIESVVTFVLGLVAEPPAPQFVYKPQPRRQSIIEGLKVVDKYNCTGCHTLEMERWKLAYNPDQFPSPAKIKDYPFLIPHATPQEVKASLATDVRGLRHATIAGMADVNEAGHPLRMDEDGGLLDEGETETTNVKYPFVLWDNTVINGEVWGTGVQKLLVPESAVEKRYPPVGGYLARLIYPAVVADEKKLNPNAKADEAWGWLPPPLVNEGRKVQTNWLYEFLLDPHPIRPAVLLRMPKFNMSPAEASALVAYFTATDNADYPYDFDQRTRESYLASAEAEHPHLLKDALKIVTDNNYCVKCHLVGDFQPAGSDRAKAPHLDQVYKRLRPGFVRPWIANPKRLLPYTGMPVNIPFDKPVSQELFHGDSVQQLDGLVDFLMNYNRYAESQTSIKPLIKAAPPADGAAAN